MAERRGYRVERLLRRKRERVERSQAWFLYVLGGVVAFVAVLGAWYVSDRWLHEDATREGGGYLAALELTVPGKKDPVAGALVVQDDAGSDAAVYYIPPDLLLEGPNGEYVFAGDAMAAGTFQEDLSRAVDAPIDAVYRIPAQDLTAWSGSDGLAVDLKRPVVVDVGDGTHTYKDGAVVPSGEVPAILAATGPDRKDVVSLQTALLRSALQAAAMRPAAERSSLGGRETPRPSAGPPFDELVRRLTSGNAVVQRFPAGVRVAEGQLAFVPFPADVMSQITRKAPGYHADVTVQVRNGSGRLGVGEAVVERLSRLDVNLPAPLNASDFTYRQTQIMAGPDTLPVARDIRAILGRGVVLDGKGLPKGTIEVIVGDDVRISKPAPKDTQ